MKVLFLIRHGQYHQKELSATPESLSLNDLLIQSDGQLTALGIRQAALTGVRFQHLPINTIRYSSLQRGEQTAKIIHTYHEKAELYAYTSLWEMIPSHVEPCPKDHRLLKPSEIEASIMRGEQCFNEFFIDDSSTTTIECIICHGNLIRFFITKILNLPYNAWLKMEVMNCGISQIVITDSELKLISFNDHGHLASSEKTFN